MANFKVKLTPTTPNFTLKNTSIPAARIDKMDDIVEVADNKVDGAVLVYKATTDKYELKKVLTWDAAADNYKVDGGEF
jgi:hypothetical protein